MDSNPDYVGVGANKNLDSPKSKENKKNNRPWWLNVYTLGGLL